MRGFDILVPLCLKFLEFGFLLASSECLNRIRNEVVFKSESSITQDLVETNETVLNLIPGESVEKNATPSGFRLFLIHSNQIENASSIPWNFNHLNCNSS